MDQATIDPSVRSNLTHFDVAYNLQEHIKCRFFVKNGQRFQHLKTELATCRIKGLPIQAYYEILMQLWTSLKDYQQAKTMEEVTKEREDDKLHQFLMGLDDTLYGDVKSNLLSWTLIPSLDEAYNVSIQDEESKPVIRLLVEQTEECKTNAKSEFGQKALVLTNLGN